MQGFALYPFDPPGDVAALRADLRAWLAANQPTADIVARANCWASFDPDFSRALGAAGYVGMTLPARYGGGDRTPLARYEIRRAPSRKIGCQYGCISGVGVDIKKKK